MNGILEVAKDLSFLHRKNLIEGAVIGKIRFGLEVISSATEKDLKKYSSLQIGFMRKFRLKEIRYMKENL